MEQKQNILRKRTVITRFFAQLLSRLLVGILLFSAGSICVSAEEGTSYRYYDGSTQSWVEGTASATELTDSSTSWSGTQWYVAKGNITINDRVNVQGTVNLILADGCKLNVSRGIHLSDGNTLNIYGQSAGTGILNIQSVASDNAGIGGNNGENCGTFSIYGGTFSIAGGFDAPGIGGGRNGSGGNITIYDGDLTVRGGDWGAGIGGGGGAGGGSGGTIAILGGHVKATGGEGGAGIGSGSRGNGSNTNITISGGVVEARGGYLASGIGGGRRERDLDNGTGGHISITGGNVTAVGGDKGAGIGGGGGVDGVSGADGGDIQITGGTVNATGGSNGAGIGGGGSSRGTGGSGGDITIAGGTVTSQSSGSGTGIGAGTGGSGNGSNGTFSTGDQGNAVITTPSISDSSGTDSWNGIIFQGNAGQVYGDVTIQEGELGIPSGGSLTVRPGSSLTIPPGSTIEVPSGSSLVIPEGAVLNNNADIEVSGTLEADNIAGTGSVSFKDNGTFQTGSGDPMIFPSGGTVGSDGSITADKIQLGDTTVTLPAGGKAELSPEGSLSLPGGAVIEKVGNPPVTIPDGGGIWTPGTGEITENACTVTFDSQGGSAVSPVQVQRGGKAARPADPVFAGHVFRGWYKESACRNPWDFDADRVEGNMTLYAKWSDAGDPFIENDPDIQGWQSIKEKVEKTDNGGTVNVDMNGTSIVPGEILELIRGRDVTLVFRMENGIRWSVDGKTIAAGQLQDIDFSVQADAGNIPSEIVDRTAGERYRLELGFRFDGAFGFTAVLSIYLGDQNAGLRARLYQYDENTGKLELVRSAQVSEDGILELPFAQAASYLIVTEKEPAEGDTDKPGLPDTPSTPGTGGTSKPSGGSGNTKPKPGDSTGSMPGNSGIKPPAASREWKSPRTGECGYIAALNN